MNHLDKDQIAWVENVSVQYTVMHRRVHSLKEYALRRLFSTVQYREIWALKGISFSMRKGEIVGVIGDNGAGKTTLLRTLAGAIKPTTGRVIVKGKIGSILGLSAGLDPELSGIENIFLSGSMQGFSRREIAGKVDGILEFSELEDFAEIPLRVYSDGMVARLAFAIATDIDPEILLIDEAFSVGDIEFRKKCIARLNTFRNSGINIVIVSHDLDTLEKICDRMIWIESGVAKFVGTPQDVVPAYLAADHKPFG